jgi:hypothetical protein
VGECSYQVLKSPLPYHLLQAQNPLLYLLSLPFRHPIGFSFLLTEGRKEELSPPQALLSLKHPILLFIGEKEEELSLL